MSDWARLTIQGRPFRALDSVRVDYQGVALRFPIQGRWPGAPSKLDANTT